MISMRYILLIFCLFPICIVAVILQQQQRRQQNQHKKKRRLFPFGRMTLEKRDSDRNLSAAASTTKAAADANNNDGESSSTTASRSNDDIIDDEVIASMIEEIPEDVTQIHLIVLVHGWMGNALEMEILRKSLDAKTTAAISKMAAEEIKTNSKHHFMTYSTTVNEQRTHDGIAAGGTRLANEINQILRSLVSSENPQQQRQDKENNSNSSNNNKREKQQRNSNNNRRTVTLSFVGNSLGGLYSRYALGEIQFQLDNAGMDNIVIPKLFITTATPHLGIKQNTFIKVPRLIERPIALAMKQTGLDLFSFSSTLHKMTIEPKFVDPLQKFEHRICYVNVHGTDFQVPTATAAFWEENSESEHFLCTFGEENEILATEDEEEAAATAASCYCPMTTPRSRRRSSSALAAVNTATAATTSSFSYDNDDQDEDDDDDGPHESIVAIYKTKSNPKIFDDVNRKEKKKSNDGDAVAEEVSLSKYLDAMGWTKVLVDVRPMLPSFSNNNSDDDGDGDDNDDSDDNNENDDPAKIATADKTANAPTKPVKDVVQESTSAESGGCGGAIGTTPTTESSSSSVSLNAPRRSITSTTAKDLLKEYGGGQFLTIPLGHTVMVANAKNELYGWINQGGRPIMDSLASKMVDYLLLSSSSESPASEDNSKQ